MRVAARQPLGVICSLSAHARRAPRCGGGRKGVMPKRQDVDTERLNQPG
jgi:hypothetical protein